MTIKLFPDFSARAFSLVRVPAVTAFLFGFAIVAMAAQSDENRGNNRRSRSADQTLETIIRRGTPADAVSRLVVERNIPISYDYIATLMRIPNAFGEGAACVVCHSSNDPKKAYRGLDLSTCEGILKGTTELPSHGPVVVAGDSEKSLITRFLRNNRMPMGVPFDYPTDTKPILTIRKWIDDGAKNDGFFNKEVLPLFETRKAFGIFAACTDCHMSSKEPPSFNGLDLTSYQGVMAGAHAVSRVSKGLPPRKVIKPGDADDSVLYQRLTQNRMPAGINPSESRDHPNVRLLMRWIEQGAKCN